MELSYAKGNHSTWYGGVHITANNSEYLYKALAFTQHTETGEKLVIYQGLYDLLVVVPMDSEI